MVTEFTRNIIFVIRNIPKGKVLSYGAIAKLAGKPNGSRHVVRTLHSSSQKYDLPWHRVVNSKGRISLKDPIFYDEQKHLLESEGIVFSANDQIDFKKYLWDVQSLAEIIED